MPDTRVATYNISGGITEDRRFYSKRGNAECAARVRRAQDTIGAMAELLRDEGIEIAALQEVDTCYSGKQTLRQAQELAARLSADVAYRPLFDYHLGRHTNVTTGLATLSRLPIRRQTPVDFPQRRVPWKRKLKARLLGAKGALHTVHEVDGEPLHVVNAHLSHDIDAQKECELSLLLEYCSQLDPVILLGDLNTTPRQTRSADMVEGHYFAADRCMSLLASHLRRYPDLVHVDPRLGAFRGPSEEINEICTYPSQRPSIKLDYCIGFSRRPGFSMSNEQVLSSTLSNHCASAVRVRWR